MLRVIPIRGDVSYCRYVKERATFSHVFSSRIVPAWPNVSHGFAPSLRVPAVMEVIAFMQKDMIRLRIFECIAMFCMATYMWIKTDGFLLDCKLLWSAIHFIVNASHLSIFAYRYFSLELTHEEQLVFDGLFNIFTRAEMKAIQKNYNLREYSKNAVVARVNEPLKDLLLILRGTVVIEDENGVKLTRFSVTPDNPQFIGEVSFYTQGNASATVKVESKTLLAITWDLKKIRNMASMVGNTVSIKAHRQIPALLARQIAMRTKTLNERAIKNRKSLKKINRKLAKEKARRESQTKELMRIRRNSQTGAIEEINTTSNSANTQRHRRESFTFQRMNDETTSTNDGARTKATERRRKKKSRRGSFSNLIASVMPGMSASSQSDVGLNNTSSAIVVPLSSFNENTVVAIADEDEKGTAKRKDESENVSMTRSTRRSRRGSFGTTTAVVLSSSSTSDGATKIRLSHRGSFSGVNNFIIDPKDLVRAQSTFSTNGDYEEENEMMACTDEPRDTHRSTNGDSDDDDQIPSKRMLTRIPSCYSSLENIIKQGEKDFEEATKRLDKVVSDVIETDLSSSDVSDDEFLLDHDMMSEEEESDNLKANRNVRKRRKKRRRQKVVHTQSHDNVADNMATIHDEANTDFASRGLTETLIDNEDNSDEENTSRTQTSGSTKKERMSFCV